VPIFLSLSCARVETFLDCNIALKNDINFYCKSGLQLFIGGKKNKGRPRTTWRRKMMDKLSTTSLRWNTALNAAQNRRAWKVLHVLDDSENARETQ
jgi:hypothetical protein